MTPSPPRKPIPRSRGGRGDDQIILNNEGQGEVEYGVTDQSTSSGNIFVASDGSDLITDFKRGIDVFVFTSNDQSITTLEAFLAAANGADTSSLLDKQIIARPNFERSGDDFIITGITLHFRDGGLTTASSEGFAIRNPFLRIEFHADSRLTWDAFVTLIGESNLANDIAILDLTLLPLIFGEGSLAFTPSEEPVDSSQPTRLEVERQPAPVTTETEAQMVIATINIDNNPTENRRIQIESATDEDGNPIPAASFFEMVGNNLVMKAGAAAALVTAHGTTFTITVGLMGTTVTQDIEVEVELEFGASANPYLDFDLAGYNSGTDSGTGGDYFIGTIDFIRGL